MVLRVRLILSVLVLIAVPIMVVGQGQKTTGQQDKIKQFAMSWAESFASNNASRLLAHYENSDELEVRMPSGIKVQGFKGLKKLYESEMKKVKFSNSKAKRISIRQFSKVAIVSFEHPFEMTFLSSKRKFAMHVQTVLVLKMFDKKWLIVNEHSSSIHDLPSFKQLDDQSSR